MERSFPLVAQDSGPLVPFILGANAPGPGPGIGRLIYTFANVRRPSQRLQRLLAVLRTQFVTRHAMVRTSWDRRGAREVQSAGGAEI